MHSMHSPKNPKHAVLGCPWNLVTIVSKLGYNLFRGRNQPTYIGVIIHLLSTMDIPVEMCEISVTYATFDDPTYVKQTESISRR